MKKIFSLILSIVMLFSITAGINLSAYAEVDEYGYGTCGDYMYWVLDDGTVSIAEYNGSASNLTIPSTLDGFKVTSIDDSAFYGCESLKNVTIPSYITSIGEGAFEYCERLTSFTIDANNKNYSSANGVLYNKNKTELIQYPIGKTSASFTIPNSVTSIGFAAFSSCQSLTSVVIPNSVVLIDGASFADCQNLKSVVIPNSVKTIGNVAFNNCYKLSSITIPNSVTSIGFRAFECCTSLKEITIPNSVELIGSSAFYCCPALESATIGSGVKKIDSQAFGWCDNLKSITIKSKNCKFEERITDKKATICGYKGSTAESYAKEYGNKFVALSDSSKLSTPTLKVTVNSNGTFKMTWNKISGAEKYEIYYKQADGSYKLLKTVTGTSYTTVFAQYGKQYSYKMKAVKGSTKSDYSKVVNATNNKKLQTPTLKVSVNSNGTFKMTWNKVTGATSYQIYWKQANGSYKLLKTVTGTSYTSGFAQYGKQYSYKMRAVTSKNSSATSNYSSVVNAKNTKKLGTPTMKATVNKNGSFKLSWGKVTGATSYQIYWKQANGSYKLLKTVSGTSYTTVVGAKDKTYTYKVRAVTNKNSSAASNYSNVVNAKRK